MITNEQLELIDEADLEPIEVSFIVPGKPLSKARHRSVIRNGKIRTYSDPRMTTAQNTIAKWYRSTRNAGVAPSTHGFGVEARFCFDHRQRQDVDNMLKLVCDALTGVAWVDDSQVTEVHGYVWYGESWQRTEIRVYPTYDLPDHATRQCEYCGTVFRTYKSRSRQKYCDRPCRSAALKRARRRTCAHCGDSFYPKKSDQVTHCSRECRSAANSVTTSCQGCGKPVHRPNSWVKGEIWCSRDCRNSRAIPVCPAGHSYDEANTYVNSRGQKECRECRAERSRQRFAYKQRSALLQKGVS